MPPAFKRTLIVVSIGAALGAHANVAAGAPSPFSAFAAAVSETRAATGTPSIGKLLGANVRDRTGASVGEVKDVVIDTDSGRAHYVVLASGGALGIGEKFHAVPLSRVRFDAKGAVTLDLAKADLTPATAFDSAKLRSTDVPRVGVASSPRDAGSQNARARRASDVIKANVRDSHGGTIGKVDDLLLDAGGSRIERVVVRFDRAWNPDDKLIALPYSSFADGATFTFKAPVAAGAAPPRNAPPTLALMNPSSEPTKGTASAVNPPGSVETRPPAGVGAAAPLERQPLKTTTSYADDEGLVYKGTREQLRDAPAFVAKRSGG